MNELNDAVGFCQLTDEEVEEAMEWVNEGKPLVQVEGEINICC